MSFCASRSSLMASRKAATPLLRCATMRSTGKDGMTSPAPPWGGNVDADRLCGGVIHDVLLLLLPPLSERLTRLVKGACQFEGAEHLTKIGVFSSRGCERRAPLRMLLRYAVRMP
nr:Uncharacterised protein [Klebsiella pneumoniae]